MSIPNNSIKNTTKTKNLSNPCLKREQKDTDIKIIKIFKNIINSFNFLKRKDLYADFYIACKTGNIKIVKKLLRKIDPNKEDNKNRTSLYIACKNGCIKIVKELLKHKDIDPSKENKKYNSLNIAVNLNKVNIVKELLKHKNIDPNNKRSTNWNPLYTAVCLNNLIIVKGLLKHKNIALNNKESANWDLLYTEVYFNNLIKIEIVKELLKHPKIDPNINNPLYSACHNGHIKLVKELLKHKNIKPNNKRKKTFYTPLYIACKKGYLEIVKKLLKHKKIDPNKGYGEHNPLYQAYLNNNIEIVRELLKHPKIDPEHELIKELLSRLIALEKDDTIFIKQYTISQLNYILLQMIIKTKKKFESPLNYHCFEYILSHIDKDFINLAYAYKACKKLYHEKTEITSKIKNSKKFKKIFAIHIKMHHKKNNFQDLKILINQ